MDDNYLLKFLENQDMPTITKKRHTYLTYYGLEQQDTYVLKEGIIKTSIILRDGREFNISYIKAPDIISLLKDEVSQYTSAHLMFVLKVIQQLFIVFQEFYFGNL